jgi:adenylylsulfate kinase-like enzyme
MLYKQKPILIWFTGLPGSGKSSIAKSLEFNLSQLGFSTFLLDENHLRKGLNSDLGKSTLDYSESARRIGEVAVLMIQTGLIVMVCAVSPLKKQREEIIKKVGQMNFIEVYLDRTDSSNTVETVNELDYKDLVESAMELILYEEPSHPDFHFQTTDERQEGLTQQLLDFIVPKVSLGNQASSFSPYTFLIV